MDLAAFALTPTTTIELEDASGRVIEFPDGTDENGVELFKRITVVVCHANDAEAQKFASRVKQKRLNTMTHARKMKLDVEDLHEEATEFLAFCIKSWKNVVINGEELQCTQANKIRLLTDPAFPFIRQQIDSVVNDGSEFLGNSQKS